MCWPGTNSGEYLFYYSLSCSVSLGRRFKEVCHGNCNIFVETIPTCSYPGEKKKWSVSSSALHPSRMAGKHLANYWFWLVDDSISCLNTYQFKRDNLSWVFLVLVLNKRKHVILNYHDSYSVKWQFSIPNPHQ